MKLKTFDEFMNSISDDELDEISQDAVMTANTLEEISMLSVNLPNIWGSSSFLIVWSSFFICKSSVYIFFIMPLLSLNPPVIVLLFNASPSNISRPIVSVIILAVYRVSIFSKI